MNPRQIVSIDPRHLHLPGSRRTGADPYKLQRQIAKFGTSTSSMPPPEVYRVSDGELLLYNGVTRATRVAKLLPGRLITVEILDDLPMPVGSAPTLGSILP